ncbi:hypothetical protein FHX81_1588 [Saccharothrix saharensis]|uniref:Tetratricopeptide repeat protein n=1 Tax=Saccharothrix saharensis TaxID=571190 RepID=A0A543J8X4_9PSEU|nr:hypothetical protein [Saccharothrix saharensis]TQM79285.1 hypothetical protein FHX81_1588 [Saccharothrix saharensis]
MTQSADAGPAGFVVQAGRDVNLRTGAPVTTRYRHQVKRIVPARLLDRDAELAELAAFCSGASPGGYQWWRAEAWAGKTALLSWFVLNPPPGVRVVSFFVTARLAGQANRTAFVSNVLEQLLTLVGEEKPQFLDPATSEAHLLGLLEEAAALCRERGERLVLVVDGLDEDQSVTAGPDSHSIAGLLPAHPAEGLRIVVAGRPDPPVPGDVPDDHPLRDGDVVRRLGLSEHARALRTEMERDLKSLLAGPDLGRTLLGLVVAAGGGLTADDLAELAHTGAWQVRDHLKTVSGRSFTRRDSDLNPGADPEVYLLAHEELQVTATEMLGPAGLAAHRAVLHDWAAGYRQRGWPAGTPEYLLRGYHTMLLAVEPDRAAALCADGARNERLFERTGGDSGALTQITATLDALVGAEVPDLVAIGRLAVHRDFLSDRNTHVPPAVAGVRVRMGQPRRGSALARSIPDPHRRALALVSAAEALVAEGHRDQAADLLDEAVETTGSIPDPERRSSVSAAVGVACAKAGDHDRAARIADSTPHHDHRNDVWTAVAVAAAKAGHHDRALEVARSIRDSFRRGPALGLIAVELAERGHDDQATHLLAEAERTALGIIDHYLRVVASTQVAVSWSDADRPDRAGELVDGAVRTARSIPDTHRRTLTCAPIAKALAKLGRSDEAVDAVRRIPDVDRWNPVLVSVARMLAAAGREAEAGRLLDDVEWTSRSITDPEERSASLVSVAGALAEAGHHDRAHDLLHEALLTARSIAGHRPDGPVVASAAVRLAEAGHHEQAGRMVDRALEFAHSDNRLNPLVSTLVSAAIAAERLGLGDHAADLLREAEEEVRRPGADSELVVASLAAIPIGWARIGHYDTAVRRAGAMPSAGREQALSGIACALVARGDHDRAVALVLHERRSDFYPEALAEVAQAMAAPGNRAGVEKLLDHLTGLARAEKPVHGSRILLWVARVLILIGNRGDAEDLVREMFDQLGSEDLRFIEHDMALLLSQVLADLGDHERALRIARGIAFGEDRAKALATLAEALAVAGRHDQAMRLVDEVPEADVLSNWRARNRIAEQIAAVSFLAGRCDQAAAAVRSVGGAENRCRALMRLAHAPVAPEHATQALRFAAQALRSEHWSTALDDLAAVSLPTLLAMAEEFTALAD